MYLYHWVCCCQSCRLSKTEKKNENGFFPIFRSKYTQNHSYFLCSFALYSRERTHKKTVTEMAWAFQTKYNIWLTQLNRQSKLTFTTLRPIKIAWHRIDSSTLLSSVVSYCLCILCTKHSRTFGRCNCFFGLVLSQQQRRRNTVGEYIPKIEYCPFTLHNQIFLNFILFVLPLRSYSKHTKAEWITKSKSIQSIF